MRGVSHGTRTRWFADGGKKSEVKIVDGRLTGVFREWHANGRVRSGEILPARGDVGLADDFLRPRRLDASELAGLALGGDGIFVRHG